MTCERRNPGAGPDATDPPPTALIPLENAIMQNPHRSADTRTALTRTALAVTVSAALLAACGGGAGPTVGDTNTSSPIRADPAGTPVALGVVTGFGSVYIDGERYDDAAAETAVEDADGRRQPALLKLGQRVRALHDGQAKASRVLVDAAVVGAVTAVDGAARTLTVAAQVVRANADAAAGPVTHFGGGYSALTDVKAGDDVEVHGSPVFDPATQRYVVQATRIEKLDSRSHYRVSGSVSALGGDSFKINGLTVAYNAGVVKPTGAALADGGAVIVFGTQFVGGTLTATAVRVLKAEAVVPPAKTQVALGGFVSARDAAAGTLVVDGQTVRLGSVAPTPAGASLVVGSYVKLAGVMAADGVVDAQRLNVRTVAADDELAKVRLAGEVTDLADAASFVVRGVPVDASGVTPTGCAEPLADGTLVQVEAQAQAGTDVVRASRIECIVSVSARPRETLGQGVLWPVDAANRTFTLTDARSKVQVKVRWDDKTAFLGLPVPGSAQPQTQVLRTVRVEGYQEGDTLVARVVRDATAAAGRREADRFRSVDKGAAAAALEAWAAYRRKP